MAKQENSMSGSNDNDAGARLSLLKTTLLSTSSGSVSNTNEPPPGITGTHFTPLPTISSPEDISNSGFRRQGLADQDASGISTNEEHAQGPVNNTSSNTSSSADILITNYSANSSTNSSGNQALEGAMPKRYFCKVCDQGFTRKHNMASHELIHSSSKPHVCRVCDSKFRRIHDLKRHEKLHTGEKPFHCSKCTRRFARPDALIRHQNSPNACSGNITSVNKSGASYFSQIMPPGSTSVSAMSSPTTNTDSKVRDSDLSRWKIFQNGGQNSPSYHAFPSAQPLHNDRPLTLVTSNTRPASDNEQQGQQLNDYYHTLENREPYFSTQNQYSPKQVNHLYLPYYLSVSNSHSTNLNNNPPFPHARHSNKHSSQQHIPPTGFVTMSKYQDLVAYTHRIQESLLQMDSRVKYLEDHSANWIKEDDLPDRPKGDNNDNANNDGRP